MGSMRRMSASDEDMDNCWSDEDSCEDQDNSDYH